MSFEFDSMYAMGDEVATIFGVLYMIYYLFAIGFAIAGYVLSSVGLHSIAKRRGITNPWLAWIPVASAWIVGSISDQFRYVTKGQIKNKRKILLTLAILTVVAIAAFYGLMIVGAIQISETAFIDGAEAVPASLLSVVAGMVLMALVMLVLSITLAVFHYMAMYDVYSSVNPAYNVAFLVLSIVFNFTEPYFIFFNRKKDRGMPPRCDTAAEAIPQPLLQEPWENNPES